MLSNYPQPDTAIIIDGDWLHYAAKRLNRQVDYSRLWDALQSQFGPHAPIYFFGSPRPNEKAHNDFLSALSRLGYVVELARLVKQNERYMVKGLEVRIAIRALSLPPEINSIVFITGDSDFVPLLEQLKHNEKSITIVTVPPASRSLMAVANYHYSLDNLLYSLESGKILLPKKDKSKVVPPKNWYIEQGEHFTPYLVVRNLFMSAKSEIVVIDPYIDDQILYMIQLLPHSITIKILSGQIQPADFCIQVRKLRQEGYQVHVYKTNVFHDRFLSIDNQWWHSGHSFKDLGGKDSLITQIDEEEAINKLRYRVNSILSKIGEYCA
jgi:uncharacterized LabA/DUF88 family protein